MHWFPKGQLKQSSNDIFVLTSTEGRRISFELEFKLKLQKIFKEQVIHFLMISVKIPIVYKEIFTAKSFCNDEPENVDYKSWNRK